MGEERGEAAVAGVGVLWEAAVPPHAHYIQLLYLFMGKSIAYYI